jgi:hypothetical protein
MHVSVKAIIKVAAHTGDASSLDWHPTKPFVLATGGSGDRCVKVWNLESYLDMSKKDHHDPSSVSMNSNTWNTTKSEVSTNSASSSETERSVPSSVGVSIGSSNGPGYNTTRSGSVLSGGGRFKSSTSAFSQHVLSISASVTHVRWRPPSNDFLPPSSNDQSSSDNTDDDEMIDRHDAMLAVATARLTSAGGSGILSMWSFNRPYMALSVVEGHEEGAVADFAWLQAPLLVPKTKNKAMNQTQQQNIIATKKMSSDPTLSTSLKPDLAKSRLLKGAGSSVDEVVLIRPSVRGGERNNTSFDAKESDNDDEDFSPVSFVWQHVLSIGRDGRCILQSFAKGDRPIRHVPSSCFAMANLSPFQRGYGSLQCFSVYQDVPNRIEDDFMLTALRQDEYTAQAPGVFREDNVHEITLDENECLQGAGKRLPATMPELVFSVVDQGNLDAHGLPIEEDDGTVCVAPEVVHLSRFARWYKMYPDSKCPSRVDLCLHNGMVAEQLKCGPLARMWKSVASILRGSGFSELPHKSNATPSNAFQFVIFPTIKALLFERADAGDVQTCVALCEVLQVVESGGQTRIPGLGITMVREWYLSYIDLLHQMCLFSAAAFIIKNCKDEAIGALNQQSTT